MKKFKNLLSIFLVALFVFSIGANTAFAENNNFDLTENERPEALYDETFDKFEALAMEQLEAMKAHEVLYGSFKRNGAEGPIYPDNYAGHWIDGSQLHVAIVKGTDNTFKELLQGFECVVFEEAQYSYNELSSLEEQAYNALKKNHNVVAYFTDVKENKAVIEVANLDMAKARSELDAAIEKKNVTARSGAKIDSFAFVITSGEEVKNDASLIGGMEISKTVSGSSYSSTLGMCGTYNGSAAFVTSGHNGVVNAVFKRDGATLGTLSKLCWSEGSNGDYAIVTITNGDTTTNKIYGSTSAATRTIIGTADDLAVGTYVMKYGKAYGYANGYVDATNVTSTSTGSYSTKGLTRCSIDTGSAGNGDSGGPYYAISTAGGSNYNFVGVHKGSTSTSMYFTPYVRFKSYFTVKTS